MCRCQTPVAESVKSKISLFCHVEPQQVYYLIKTIQRYAYLENFGYFIFWWKILFYTLWILIFHAVHLNFVMWTKLLMINTNSNHISCFHCEFMTWLFLSVKFVFSFWYSGILHCRCFPFMTFPLYTESPYCWRSKACQSTWWRGSTWTTPPPTTTGGCCAGKISPAGKPEIVKLQRI